MKKTTFVPLLVGGAAAAFFLSRAAAAKEKPAGAPPPRRRIFELELPGGSGVTSKREKVPLDHPAVLKLLVTRGTLGEFGTAFLDHEGGRFSVFKLGEQNITFDPALGDIMIEVRRASGAPDEPLTVSVIEIRPAQ